MTLLEVVGVASKKGDTMAPIFYTPLANLVMDGIEPLAIDHIVV